MRKYLLFLLFAPAMENLMAQTDSSAIAGEYFLQGVMETASVILLKPDSSFEFFYSYGSVDRTGTGKWSINKGQLTLNSRPRPARDFKLDSSTSATANKITVRINCQNKMLLSYVHCVIQTKTGMKELDTDQRGNC